MIAILEPIIAYAEDKWNIRRRLGCVIFGVLAWAIGLLSVYSFNKLSDFTPILGRNLYNLIDYATANLMMPLGGILIALFVGWRIAPSELDSDLSFSSRAMFTAWIWMLRVVAPLAIGWVLWNGV